MRVLVLVMVMMNKVFKLLCLCTHTTINRALRIELPPISPPFSLFCALNPALRIRATPCSPSIQMLKLGTLVLCSLAASLVHQRIFSVCFFIIDCADQEKLAIDLNKQNCKYEHARFFGLIVTAKVLHALSSRQVVH